MDERKGRHTVHAIITATTIVLLIYAMQMRSSHVMIATIYIHYVGVATGSIF
jgi:hypothetical protein